MSDAFGRQVHGETFYYVGDRRVPLFPNPGVLVVRFADAARSVPEVLSERARKLLAAARPVAFLPREGFNVYRADRAPAVVDALREEAGVAQAFPAYQHTAEGGDTVILTPRLLAQFKPELAPERIGPVLESMGLRILEPLPYASPNGFLLQTAPRLDGRGALVAANTLVEEGLVTFAEPDLLQSRQWRQAMPPDPAAAAYLNQQWHLSATGVPEAWKETTGGAAIRIAVLDDGLDSGHPEFQQTVATGLPKVAAQFDFATGSADASPKTYFDNHGTACAGVAASAGLKAAGAAPGCRLVVARTPDYPGASDEARMFQWTADAGADVIVCSWGPVDGTGPSPLPTPTRLAIRYCLTNGRTGRGIPIFWAAGNGSESVDDDGYAANPDVMAISACTAAGDPAPYSDYGAAVFACAPSNGRHDQPAIFTTDRLGTAGYNPGSAQRGDPQGDYCNDFGGTSAAAPLAAGIAALALSADPALTAAQVRQLLRDTADRIGDPSNYDADGHSDQFGYGRLSAAAAVRAARHSASDPPATPTILGPASWSRVDSPPTFHVDPSPHAWYVVEVAASPELFDASCGGGRSADTFYGSWSDAPFQSGPTYVLPVERWARLRTAERLWYRVGSSASATGYADYVVSTADDRGEKAPSITIVPGVGAAPPTPEAARRTVSDLMGRPVVRDALPTIEGPLRWDRGLGPPTFRVEPSPATDYGVELGADPACLDPAAPSGNATTERRFTSGWIQAPSETGAPRIGFLAYVPPVSAWETLGQTDRLYYRLVTRTSASLVCAMDLTGPAAASAGKAETPVRPEEALWRLPE